MMMVTAVIRGKYQNDLSRAFQVAGPGLSRENTECPVTPPRDPWRRPQARAHFTDEACQGLGSLISFPIGP